MNLHPIHQKLCSQGRTCCTIDTLVVRRASSQTVYWIVVFAAHGKDSKHGVHRVMDGLGVAVEWMHGRASEGRRWDGSIVLGQLKPRGCSKAAFCFNYCLRKGVRESQWQPSVTMEYFICSKEHRHIVHLQKPCIRIFHGYPSYCDLHVLYTKGMVMGF